MSTVGGDSMAEKPGVVLYFDTLHALEALSDSQRGRMLTAIGRFSEHGEAPDFDDDSMLTLAWGFIEPRIVMDDSRYKNSILQRQYAVFVREKKKLGEDVPSFEVWKERSTSADIESERPMIADASRYPTKNTNSSSISATSLNTAAEANSGPDPAAALLREYGIHESVSMMRAVTEDLETHSKEAVADALRRAADADTRGGVSVNFYRAILNGQGQPRQTCEGGYMRRTYDDDFFKSLEVNLDEL